jgi:hypothetical protein
MCMKKISIISIMFSILFISLISSFCIPAFEAGEQNCTGFSCVNESFPQHLAERSSFFAFLPIYATLFLSLVVLVFYSSRVQLNHTVYFFQIRKSQKRFCTKLFDFIVEVFSGGILHSKIFAHA